MKEQGLPKLMSCLIQDELPEREMNQVLTESVGICNSQTVGFLFSLMGKHLAKSTRPKGERSRNFLPTLQLRF